jgi:hypothetical protein
LAHHAQAFAFSRHQREEIAIATLYADSAAWSPAGHHPVTALEFLPQPAFLYVMTKHPHR